jgi:ELWxxDGT repeat protein
LVADIVPGSASSGILESAVAGNRFFFTANDGVHGSELWTSLGTAATTRMVKDIHPGPDGFAIQNLDLAAAAGSWLFFSADDGVHGQELWVTNGTEARTQLVADINPGSAGSSRRFGHEPIAAPGKLFFFADDGVHGAELWALPLPRLTPRVYLPVIVR